MISQMGPEIVCGHMFYIDFHHKDELFVGQEMLKLKF